MGTYDDFKLRDNDGVIGEPGFAPRITQKPDNFAGGILAEAQKIVTGDRALLHGNKEYSFALIATFWTAYLDGRKIGGAVTPMDVAWMMSLLKIARAVQGSKNRDNAVDCAGYAAIAGELT